MPILLLDLREESELREDRLEATTSSDAIQILRIPSRVLFANVAEINRQLDTNRVSQLWLVCRTGRRSDRAKELYFAEDDRVESIAGGVDAAVARLPSHLTHIKSNTTRFGMQQYMQLMFASILLLLAVAADAYVRFAAMAMAGLILLQVGLKQCWLSLVVPWPQPVDSAHDDDDGNN